MEKQGKVWGETRKLFNKNNVEVSRIEVEKGGFSSTHKHEHKYNKFFVESGKLKILVWKNDYDLCDETIISEGESTVIVPGEDHMFEALEDTTAYEIYWVGLTDDIVRKNHGGLKRSS